MLADVILSLCIYSQNNIEITSTDGMFQKLFTNEDSKKLFVSF